MTFGFLYVDDIETNIWNPVVRFQKRFKKVKGMHSQINLQIWSLNLSIILLYNGAYKWKDESQIYRDTNIVPLAPIDNLPCHGICVYQWWEKNQKQNNCFFPLSIISWVLVRLITFSTDFIFIHHGFFMPQSYP